RRATVVRPDARAGGEESPTGARLLSPNPWAAGGRDASLRHLDRPPALRFLDLPGHPASLREGGCALQRVAPEDDFHDVGIELAPCAAQELHARLLDRQGPPVWPIRQH